MATTSPKHKGSNLKRIRNLELEAASLRTHLWWIVGGGEFAAWAEAKAMPLAARQEFDAARAIFTDSIELAEVVKAGGTD